MKFLTLCFLALAVQVQCRRHRLNIKNDYQSSILCSQFGFLKNGFLDVSIQNLNFAFLTGANAKLGFSLDKTKNANIASYLENKGNTCVFNDPDIKVSVLSAVLFTFDFSTRTLNYSIIGTKSPSDLFGIRLNVCEQILVTEDIAATPNSSYMHCNPRSKASSSANNGNENYLGSGSKSIPLADENNRLRIRLTFASNESAGLYSLYFHNCLPDETRINMTLLLMEKNEYSYLSAGEQPLPYLYFAFFIAYFIMFIWWLVVLRISNKNDVFKIHYLMLCLLFVKSASLVFHGVNYYVLGKEGIHEEGWAVMYYITHLMKGLLLFITIILIGAGWAFVKYILSDNEKKVFLIAIPLQILAQVATIIVEESEEGTKVYTFWKEVFILVDLLCCGAILFPVFWSIRHLQKAVNTDGKAAENLRKLKLFRHFYIMVICYIYFTRIIVYLLRITIPFAYLWLVDLFMELATAIFFVSVGYKFRPVDNNPYLRLALHENDEESDDDEEFTVADRAWSLTDKVNGDGLARVNMYKKQSEQSTDSRDIHSSGTDDRAEDKEDLSDTKKEHRIPPYKRPLSNA